MRILRFFLFIVFLGPLKALLVAICFLLFFIAVLIIPYFRFLSPNARHFKIWAFQTVRPIIRLGLFGLGIIRINVNRPIDPEARTIVCNHLSLVETIIILQQFPVSYLAADWLARRLLIKQAAKVFDFYFVNRAKKQHGVEHLAN
jgi:1-acyl-sn-glycerol-3-phosphate acyltransferase